jgi:hypothetical protein
MSTRIGTGIAEPFTAPIAVRVITGGALSQLTAANTADGMGHLIYMRRSAPLPASRTPTFSRAKSVIPEISD